jgi:transposase-like protein
MPRKRRTFSAEFKARVALEAVRGERTINEIAAEHGVHPNQVSQWKSRLLESLPDVFSGERDQVRQDVAVQKERDELYRQIGQLKVEIDWLKKKTDPFFRG